MALTTTVGQLGLVDTDTDEDVVGRGLRRLRDSDAEGRDALGADGHRRGRGRRSGAASETRRRPFGSWNGMRRASARVSAGEILDVVGRVAGNSV